MVQPVSAKEPLPPPPPQAPPRERIEPAQWVRENLFAGPFNSLLTVVFALILGWALYRAGRFLLVTGQWEIVRRNLTNFLVGFFPRDELWRLWAALFILALAFGVRWGAGIARLAALGAAEGRRTWRDVVRRVWPLALLVGVLVWISSGLLPIVLTAAAAALLLLGREVGRRLPPRSTRYTTLGVLVAFAAAYVVIAFFGGVSYTAWRGLLLTVFLAVGGIALSFPLGVLLALGRRSSFPAVRVICVTYIELIRGVPLITLLFMAAFILGFFFPRGVSAPPLVTRALIAFVLFTAAYVAEIVRGGLQSVPKGQIEAAQAVGLSPVKVTALIVLPQALRAVIPATVGQFISLFKDTSLAAGIGLVELLGVAESVTKQPDFLGRGLHAETLVFASFVFWAGAYWMSRTSQRLERRLGVGER